MQIKYCEACGRSFQARSQTPRQTYCSEPACQRIRRLRWQREKLRSDPDYADNQTRAQQAWSKRNADYWKNYRAAHPDYVEQNRKMQRVRSARRPSTEDMEIAKMDSSDSPPPLLSGVYRMSSINASGIAKMDAWTVELRVLAYSP